MYLLRVDFPDDDRYAYVTADSGELKKFYDYSQAVEECRKYASAIIIEVKDESINWELPKSS